MAEQKLELIVDIDETGAIRGIKGIDAAMASSTAKTETETKKGFASVQKYLKDTGDRIKDQWAKIAAAAVIAFATIKKAGESVKIAADFAEQADAVEKRFGKTSDEILNVMRRATKGMISDSELLKATSRAMAMGVTTDLDEIATLWQYADAKAKVLGKETEEVFAQMADGIGKQNPRLLKELGFTSDKFKETTDGIQSTMTKAEMLQAVLAEAGPDVSKFGDEGISASDKFKVLNADLENSKLKLGQALLPIFEAIVPVIRDFVAGINSAPNGLKIMGVALSAIIPIAYGVVTALGPIGMALAGVAAAAVFAIEKIGELERARKDSEENDAKIQRKGIERELAGYEQIVLAANIASKRKIENKYKEVDAMIGGGKISAEWQKKQDQDTVEKAAQLRAKLKEDELKALKALEEAKSADRSFWNKKRLDEEQAAAQVNYDRAKQIVDTLASYEVGIGKKTAKELEAIEEAKAAKKKREQEQYDKEYKEVQDFLVQTEARGQDARLIKIKEYLSNGLRANTEQGRKLLALQKQLQAEITDEYLQTGQNEINAENQKFEEIKRLNVGNKDELVAIEKKHKENIAALNLKAKQKDADDRVKKYEEDTKYWRLGLDVAKQFVGQMIALSDAIFGNEMANIDSTIEARNREYDEAEKKRQKAFDAWAEDQYARQDITNEARDALAVMDEEDRQKKLDTLAEERDTAIANGDDVLAAEKQREIDRMNLTQEAADRDKQIALEKKALDDTIAEAKRVSDEKAAADKIALDKKNAQEKYQIELAQWRVNKGMRIADAIIGTAAAVIAALGNPVPFAGPILAAAAGVTGAIQTGIIIAEQPPAAPKFAMGGTLGGGSNYGDRTAFMGNRGETILNTNQGQNLFDALDRSGLLSQNQTSNMTNNSTVNNSQNMGRTVNIFGPVTMSADGEFQSSVDRRLRAGGTFT